MGNNLFGEVIESGLCSGCGTCVGVCPTGALSVNAKASYTPVLDEDKCVGCDLCCRVCPGEGYNIREIVEENPQRGSVFNNEQGYYEYFAHGYSNDEELRKKAASGGVATELLKFLLNEKKVDKVVVVQLKDSRPIVKITDDPREIEKAQQSKYGPVPLNMVLKEIMQSNLTYALVGTPCQIAGQYLAEKHIEKLSSKIKYKIGLFCGYVQTYDSIDQVGKGLKIRPEVSDNWDFTGWRDGGYPGSLSFRSKVTGEIRRKCVYGYYDLCIPFYSLKRCFLCVDGNNELADLVLGDVHAAGCDENVIICRTKEGDELLKAAASAGNITYRQISKQKALLGTIGGIVNSKKRGAFYVIEHLKKRLCPYSAWAPFSKGRDMKRSKVVPDFDISFEGSREQRFVAICRFRLTFLLRSKIIKSVLTSSPWLMEKIGGYLYRFPGALPGFKLMRFVYRSLKLFKLKCGNRQYSPFDSR